MSKKNYYTPSAPVPKARKSSFPEWYWPSGLHDAVILSAAEFELPPNYKDRFPRFNCLEILLDSSDAIYTRDIQALRLYNYKIRTPDVSICQPHELDWIGDRLTTLDNGRYQLDIEIRGYKHNVHFIVEFQQIEVDRTAVCKR